MIKEIVSGVVIAVVSAFGGGIVTTHYVNIDIKADISKLQSSVDDLKNNSDNNFKEIETSFNYEKIRAEKLRVFIAANHPDSLKSNPSAIVKVRMPILNIQDTIPYHDINNNNHFKIHPDSLNYQDSYQYPNKITSEVMIINLMNAEAKPIIYQ